LPFINDWGGDRTYPNLAVGWTWAFGTPYQWTKQVASHFGGTRNGMAISWPQRIADRGGIRHQFHHVLDIAPTILEAIGIPEPRSVNGVAQRPIEGISMLYTFDAAEARAPSRRRTQHFEMLGHRGIYHEGWYANTTPPTLPWQSSGQVPADVINGYTWELYNLAEDPTQSRNLVALFPDRLRDLQQRFLIEAARYQVLPLDNSSLSRLIAQRPGPSAGRQEFIYRAGRWRQWCYRDAWWTLRGLGLLPAGWPAGIHLEFTRYRKGKMGSAERLAARAAQHCLCIPA